MQLSLSLWLWVLLGINRKIKCFPDVVFACRGNVHTPHCQHLYTAPQTCYFRQQELFIARPRSHSVLNGVKVISASCSNAPSQLDALGLAASQLDTGSLSLWASSFLVPGGHFMSSLLKACCSACCHLNGAKESSPGSQLASPGLWCCWATRDPSLVLRWVCGNTSCQFQKGFHFTGLIHVNSCHKRLADKLKCPFLYLPLEMYLPSNKSASTTQFVIFTQLKSVWENKLQITRFLGEGKMDSHTLLIGV